METKIKTAIRKALNLPDDVDFQLTKPVYERLGINHKRFGQLLKGSGKSANVNEIKSIAKVFNIKDLTELL